MIRPQASAGPGDVLNLEELGPWTRGGKLRFLRYRLCLAACEMNDATRRLLELQMRLPP
jgi:hypothetical protein